MGITNHMNHNTAILRETFIDDWICCVECYCAPTHSEGGCIRVHESNSLVRMEGVNGFTGKLNKNTLEFTYKAANSHLMFLYKINNQPVQEILGESTIAFQPGTIVYITNAETNTLSSHQQIRRLLDEAYNLPVPLLAEIFREKLIIESESYDRELGFLLLGYLEQRSYPELAFELDSLLESIEVGRIRVNQFLEKYTQNICLNLWCFQEMLANAIEHGNQFDIKKKVKVHVQIREQFVIFVIADEGKGFDWRGKIRKESCLLSSNERGRGIVMSNMLCSYMIYNETGNQVTLVFTLED